ncbi:MAG: hypothetical protein NWR72_09450 [Bacteroidia bacterium]|nr:hypothetical protein [Bacteroidia bacterium]
MSPWLALMLGSVLLRLIYGKFLLSDHWPGDAHWYKDAAEALLQKGWLDHYWPPALPHLLAGGMWLGIPQEWLGMCIGLGMWILYFWVLISVVFPLGNSQRGWWIKAIFAIFPAFVHQSVVPLTYLPVAILLLMSWQWAIGAWGGSTLRDGLGLGICLGLMVLFRGASLALWPVMLWGYAWQRDRWQVAILPALIALVMVLGWEARLYQQEGRWIAINSANSYNLYLGNNAWTPDYRTWILGSQDLHGDAHFEPFYTQLDSVRALPVEQQDHAFQALAWQRISTHPGEFALRIGTRLATLFSFDTLAGATLYKQAPLWGMISLIADAICYLLLLLMAWWSWRSNAWRRGEKILWLLTVGAYSLPYLLAFSHPTYHLPLLPLFAWAAVKGESFSFTKLKRRSWFSWLILVVFLLFQVAWVINMADRL